MIGLVKSVTVEAQGLSLEDFAPDAPFKPPNQIASENVACELIDGVVTTALTINTDPRGSLVELLTTREGIFEPIVHVYQVTALPGSCRAWVYHRQQSDRLAFANGRFEVVLYDIRPTSPTKNRLNTFVVGLEQPTLIRIPPLVIHGVRNAGSDTASFVNLPTRAYDHEHPDKCRLSADDPRIPYRFNDR